MERLVSRGVILAAVDRCRPPVRAWLHFAYAAEPSSMDVLTLMIHLVRADTPGRLVEAGLRDYRNRVRGQDRADHRDLAQAVGLGVKDWRRTYRRPYEAMLDQLAAWDSEGLEQVEQIEPLFQGFEGEELP
jgi:hypothetical protein